MQGDKARRLRRAILGLGLTMAFLLSAVAGAAAGPVLEVNVNSDTTAAPGGTLDYFVWVSNVGNDVSDGSEVLTITLPTGMTSSFAFDFLVTGWDCDTFTVYGGTTVECHATVPSDPNTPGLRNALIFLEVNVDPGASGDLTSSVTVTGGGAPDDTTVRTVDVTATLPEFGIEGFDGQATASAAGDPYTQAGGHPYEISTSIFFNTFNNPRPETGPTWPVEPLKDVLVDLPPGLVGNPAVTGDSRCSQNELANTEFTVAKPLCPAGSQVGVVKVFAAAGPSGFMLGNAIPVYNMLPPADVPARFGFNVSGTVVTLDAALRSGTDYGLSVNVRNISEGLAIAGTELTFWGVPADSRHDPMRSCPGQLPAGEGGPSCSTDLPRKAFLRNPTRCLDPGEGFVTTARVDSWTDPGDFASASFTTHNPPAFPLPPDQWGAIQGTTGCDLVPFAPSFAATPHVAKANAPSGFDFDLSMPQSDDPARIGTADLKRAVVTLPAGLRVSPSSASGLGACAPASIGIGTDVVPSCPGSSKIGTVTIDTPLLDDPLTGSIYLAKPKDNPFGSLLSLYLVARGPGIVVKLPGRVDPDPLTGQLTATFDDNPQLPFSNLHLEFNDGPRAPLVNPSSCGTYTTHAVMTAWSGATVVSDSQFAISKDGNGTPCAASQFTPDLSAGGTSTKAGKNTTFDLRLSRGDDDEEFDSLGVTMPKGLLAKVAGVPLCNADVEGKAGTCSEQSRLGDVLTGSGAGENPFYLPGRAYLTGPYKGGPFGLSIVVPAIAGPFDLGTVVVRASIQLDKRTAQLRVVSDPLPRILEGIPLQIRDVRVAVNRAKFMINPTSCLQKQVLATVTSTTGKTAELSDRFQVGGCKKLSLRPKLRLTVGSKGHTRRGSSTPLIATLTQTPGQSNLKAVRVSLPLSLNALLPVVEEACTQAEFDANDCEEARTGSAVAVTPLLDEPLKGSAYFVKDPDRPKGSLPNLIVALRGQVDFDLVGRIVIPGGESLGTQFNAIPDVPISSFTLRMSAGKDGAVGVAENLCRKTSKRQKAQIVFVGQNGSVVRSSQRLHTRGCSAGKGK